MLNKIIESKLPIRPLPLAVGDRVAIIAPSSPVPSHILDLSVDSIKFLGLEPMVYPSCTMRHGYMAGLDKDRALDINNAFSDNTIKGIFCLRGGFGASRLLPLLNYDAIAANPKVFAGYSDITALHTVFNKICGFVTYHSPMPNTGYRQMDEFSLESLKNNLFSSNPLDKVYNPKGEAFESIFHGTAQGIITGGNLSLLLGTLGSPYEVDTRGKVLFIEDVGERPYRLDKALTALSLSGKFEDCAGIILGTFFECEEPDADTVPSGTIISDSSLSLKEIIEEIILPYKKPTLLNFRAGHIYPQLTIPMGTMVKFTVGNDYISFL